MNFDQRKISEEELWIHRTNNGFLESPDDDALENCLNLH